MLMQAESDHRTKGKAAFMPSLHASCEACRSCHQRTVMFNRTKYLLRMELVTLDEFLCRTLDRTATLSERANRYEETAEAERLQQISKILGAAKRSLDRLA